MKQPSHSTVLPATSAVLRVLIVLNWVFGALVLAMLAGSLAQTPWVWRALHVGVAADDARVAGAMRAMMVLGIVGVPFGHVVFTRLLAIVESVRAGVPFTLENAMRLRTIAWALLGLQLLHGFVAAIASRLVARGIPLHAGGRFQIGGWLAILLLFVLAQVFLEGTRMREDLEGTV